MRLYIIRHADPDYANDTITPAGHLEAQAVGRRLAKAGLTHLYCSPLGRAKHTCHYTQQVTGLIPVTLDWTAELHCPVVVEPWGRLAVWDTPGEIIRESIPLPTRENWYEMPVFAEELYRESFEKVQRGSDALLAAHGYVREGGRYRIGTPSRDQVAVFCHGGLGLWWLAHLLEIPLPLVWSSFWLPPSSVTTILMDERSTTWAVPRAIGVGDLGHLYAEKLPVSRAGCKANFD